MSPRREYRVLTSGVEINLEATNGPGDAAMLRGGRQVARWLAGQRVGGVRDD